MQSDRVAKEEHFRGVKEEDGQEDPDSTYLVEARSRARKLERVRAVLALAVLRLRHARQQQLRRVPTRFFPCHCCQAQPLDLAVRVRAMGAEDPGRLGLESLGDVD